MNVNVVHGVPEAEAFNKIQALQYAVNITSLHL